MGGTEQQDPKVFARMTNYLYICVVLDPPLLIMKCMNWSMASGCLASVCANSWSIMYLSATPGCSAPSACRQHGWWLIPHQRTEWQVEHRQSAACLISCSMQRPLTCWSVKITTNRRSIKLITRLQLLISSTMTMIDKVCGLTGCLVCVTKPREIIRSNIWAQPCRLVCVTKPRGIIWSNIWA